MGKSETVEQARVAFGAYRWGDAHRLLSAAVREGPLEPGDLRRLAVAALLTGREAESNDAWERAHHAFLRADDVPAAVQCAFWLAFGLLQRGETARGGGWLARAQRQLETLGEECVEQGYLLFPLGFQRFTTGDLEGAHAIFQEATQVAERFGDHDLTAFARHGQGRTLLRMGRVEEGVRLLDEVMVAVTTRETSPVVAGTVYCSVIEACREIFDVQRAQEWTTALIEWGEPQPDLVPYRGQCLVHRSQLSQFRGQWAQALEEVARARERLSDPPGQPAIGMAWYQQGELDRLRGAWGAAEQAYRTASEHGHVPQPGLALVQLARGRARAAAAAIRHAMVEAGEDRLARAALLPAWVDIALAADDVATARSAADEIVAVAGDLNAPLLEAAAEQARGAVLLAEGDAEAALPVLRRAWTRWWELQAPYETARVRLLTGEACQQLDDPGSARLEFDAARKIFDELGAAPDLARLDQVSGHRPPASTGVLSPREVEVLALVAAGKTNRQIAADLVVSEHTVRRHLQNMFSKLGITSRTAATAYAYEHDLI